MNQTTDFEFADESSLILLYPITERAKSWASEKIEIADWQSSAAIAIEPRFFEPIYDGILEEGMTLDQVNR